MESIERGRRGGAVCLRPGSTIARQTLLLLRLPRRVGHPESMSILQSGGVKKVGVTPTHFSVLLTTETLSWNGSFATPHWDYCRMCNRVLEIL